jgi:uncharacterized membrane protein
MASSKARSKSRAASARSGRPASGRGSAARTVTAVSATPTSRPASKPAGRRAEPDEIEEFDNYEEPVRERPSGPPLWLQITSLVLAVVGLAISAYETYAHFNGSHLAGCPTGGNGTFNCTAVITSSQSMVFGVIPVAVLGLLFYVAAVPLFSPWAWKLPWRWVGQVRFASMVVGMGFVMYLIYAEIYQIGDVCEYCTGVHIITFLLFCITVFSVAIWGFGARRDSAARS